MIMCRTCVILSGKPMAGQRWNPTVTQHINLSKQSKASGVVQCDIVFVTMTTLLRYNPVSIETSAHMMLLQPCSVAYSLLWCELLFRCVLTFPGLATWGKETCVDRAPSSEYQFIQTKFLKMRSFYASHMPNIEIWKTRWSYCYKYICSTIIFCRAAVNYHLYLNGIE